jgi:vancomycin resistance protein YoaR
MNANKKNIFILSVVLIIVFLTGCTSKSTIDKEKMDSMIDTFVKETDTAIQNKDIKKARKVWSEVTELSIKAKDYEELSESIEKLSTNYVKLITYIETGEEYLLNDFRKEFDVALEELKNILYSLTEEGKKKAEKPLFFA